MVVGGAEVLVAAFADIGRDDLSKNAFQDNMLITPWARAEVLAAIHGEGCRNQSSTTPNALFVDGFELHCLGRRVWFKRWYPIAARTTRLELVPGEQEKGQRVRQH